MNDQAKEKFSDIFHRNTTYPTAESIFSFQPKSIPEVKDDCIIVLDTNSLLVPFTTGKASLDAIDGIYKVLVSEKRLVIPSQVAREFAEHRVSKLVDLYQQISNLSDAAKPLELGNYPLLENLPAYQKARTTIKDVNKSIREHKDNLSDILSEISQWYWNDPVSKLYRSLFTSDVVLELEIDKDAIKHRIDRNSEFKLPPGYKDKGKQDEGVGDHIIWHTILKIGTDSKKSVIFVSLDEKADWMVKSAGQALYVRYELVDEFCRVSDGQSFHIIKFSAFLDLYGASGAVVEEVRKEEIQGFVNFQISSERQFKLIEYRINKRTKLLLAVLGLLNQSKNSFIEDIQLLEPYGFTAFDSAKVIWRMRNLLNLNHTPSEETFQMALGNGKTVLDQLEAITYQRHIVYAYVDIYSDPNCKFPIEGINGIILESSLSSNNLVTSHKIFPTTRPFYRPGTEVSWEWNHNFSTGEFWYRDPDTNEIKHFNGSSNEFIGRALARLYPFCSLKKQRQAA